MPRRSVIRPLPPIAPPVFTFTPAPSPASAATPAAAADATTLATTTAGFVEVPITPVVSPPSAPSPTPTDNSWDIVDASEWEEEEEEDVLVTADIPSNVDPTPPAAAPSLTAPASPLPASSITAASLTASSPTVSYLKSWLPGTRASPHCYSGGNSSLRIVDGVEDMQRWEVGDDEADKKDSAGGSAGDVVGVAVDTAVVGLTVAARKDGHAGLSAAARNDGHAGLSAVASVSSEASAALKRWPAEQVATLKKKSTRQKKRRDKGKSKEKPEKVKTNEEKMYASESHMEVHGGVRGEVMAVPQRYRVAATYTDPDDGERLAPGELVDVTVRIDTGYWACHRLPPLFPHAGASTAPKKRMFFWVPSCYLELPEK